MKRISLSILIATLIFSLGAGVVLATDLGTTSTTLGTGSTAASPVTIDNGELSRQTAAVTFITSQNVYMAATLSAASTAEYFVVSGAHLNGDKEYAMASSGGGVYWIAKAAGSSTLTGAPVITTAGVATWTGWTAQ